MSPFANGLDPSQSLAPPPAAPAGPRSPAQTSIGSRTPSPASPSLDTGSGLEDHHYINGLATHSGSRESFDGLDGSHARSESDDDDDMYEDKDWEGDANQNFKTPVKPSAKALGKRKLIEAAEIEGVWSHCIIACPVLNHV